MKVELRAASSEAAILNAGVTTAPSQSISLQWEIYPQGELEPLRYGLSLVRARERQTQIVVTGLSPATTYTYRVRDDAAVVAEGCFATSAVDNQVLAA